MKEKLFLLVIVLGVVGCGLNRDNEKDRGELINNIYTNDRFKWKMKTLDSWRLTTNLEKNIYNKIGDKAIKKEFKNNSIDTWTEILNIQSGIKINQMAATRSRFDKTLHGSSYLKSKEKRFHGSKKLFEDKNGVEVESIRTVTTIDGVSFDTFNMAVKKNGEHQFYQIMLEKKYNNDEILLISITATELEKLNEYKDALMSSKFERKE